ncbi:MAG: putative transporter [Candidatus Caenarcaniphilales bacterium]|nr:putative transporter [Candidatus Caenarcaniphilales bacterium]
MNPFESSTSSTLLIFAAVIFLGLLIGKIKLKGISLGVAGVLFSGIIFGHFQVQVNKEILEFIKEFGLILFVYTIGLQVSPGFFHSLKSRGLILNLLGGSIVLLGVLTTILIHLFNGVEMPVAVGLFSGATTNTPSLGAAQQLLQNLFGNKSTETIMPSLGYAVSYPFGIIGIIATIILLKTIFRISPKDEAEKFYEENKRTHGADLASTSLVIQNKNLEGIQLQQIPSVKELGIAISRIKHSEEIYIASPETTIHLGDIIYAVGRTDKLNEFEKVVGKKATVNLTEESSKFSFKEIIVTKENMVDKTLDELGLRKLYGVIITRVYRNNLKFIPNTNLHLHYGDVLRVVGDRDSLNKVENLLGNSTESLRNPKIIFVFLGIFLGILLGSVPINIPGLSVPVKLGLAGGPLIVAIFISRLPIIGSLVSYLPISSNLALRDLGITLFLACVGLKSGDKFLSTLIHGDGFLWMFYGCLITFIPLLIIGLAAWKVFKINYLSICGLLAGSMTDPPALAYTETIANSNAPLVAYATVYPLVMILRIISAQILVLAFCN